MKDIIKIFWSLFPDTLYLQWEKTPRKLLSQ